MGPLTHPELAALIEQATVDCYNESEHVSGLFTMIEDNLVIPFSTQMLDVTVTVEMIDVTADDQIVAVCSLARAAPACAGPGPAATGPDTGRCGADRRLPGRNDRNVVMAGRSVAPIQRPPPRNSGVPQAMAESTSPAWKRL